MLRKCRMNNTHLPWVRVIPPLKASNCKEVVCVKRDEVLPNIISTRTSLDIGAVGVASIASRTCVKMVTTWEPLSDITQTIIKNNTCASFQSWRTCRITYVPAPSARVGILLPTSEDSKKSPATKETRSCIHCGLAAQAYSPMLHENRKSKLCYLAFLVLSIVLSISKMVNVSLLFLGTERSISSKEPIPPPISIMGVACSSQG